MGTTTTTVIETVPTEQINGLHIPEPLAPMVWEAITWVIPKASGLKYRWITEDAGAITGTKTEGADFTDTDYSTGKSEATPATVGDFTAYTDELAVSGSRVSIPNILMRIDRRLRKRIDKDILALAPSCTSHSNYSGVALDTDKFIDAVTLFKAQYPTNQRIAFVGSAGQVGSLTKAMVNLGSGAAGAGFGNDLIAGLARVQGLVSTNFLGSEVYNGDVFIDGADAVGMFVSVADFGLVVDGEWQPGSGVGAAFWWQPRPEMQREAVGTKTNLIVSGRYGVAITAQTNVRKLTSLK